MAGMSTECRSRLLSMPPPKWDHFQTHAVLRCPAVSWSLNTFSQPRNVDISHGWRAKCWQNVVDQHFPCGLLIDWLDVLGHHCPNNAVLAVALCKLSKYERKYSDLAIEPSAVVCIEPRPCYSGHEHDLRYKALALTLANRRLFVRRQVKRSLDLCQLEPLFVDVHNVHHVIKLCGLNAQGYVQ